MFESTIGSKDDALDEFKSVRAYDSVPGVAVSGDVIPGVAVVKKGLFESTIGSKDGALDEFKSVRASDSVSGDAVPGDVIPGDAVVKEGLFESTIGPKDGALDEFKSVRSSSLLESAIDFTEAGKRAEVKFVIESEVTEPLVAEVHVKTGLFESAIDFKEGQLECQPLRFVAYGSSLGVPFDAGEFVYEFDDYEVHVEKDLLACAFESTDVEKGLFEVTAVLDYRDIRAAG